MNAPLEPGPEREQSPIEAEISRLSVPDRNKAVDDYLAENRVAIVAGARTPFVKALGPYKQYGTIELGQQAIHGLIEKLNINPDSVQELYFGSVMPDPRYPQLARELILRGNDLPRTTGAHFASNNCITGLETIHQLAKDIALGRVQIGIAGAVESMSNPALVHSKPAQDWFRDLLVASPMEKLRLLGKFRPHFLLPQPPQLAEPSSGLTMGEHTEITAKEYGITQGMQDALAYRSHINAAAARDAGKLGEEITPFAGISMDTGIWDSITMERLSRSEPKFDTSGHGTITAGNSSKPTDGAAAVCLMSEEAAKAEGREVLAYVRGIEFAAIDPGDGLLMAPAVALPRLLHRHDRKASDIDLFEVHEAFGAQVEANRLLWEQGWEKYGVDPIGAVPDDKLNVNGGSIALGHPLAATGIRIVNALVNEMKRRDLKTGVVSACAAGWLAYAMYFERD